MLQNKKRLSGGLGFVTKAIKRRLQSFLKNELTDPLPAIQIKQTLHPPLGSAETRSFSALPPQNCAPSQIGRISYLYTYSTIAA